MLTVTDTKKSIRQAGSQEASDTLVFVVASIRSQNETMK